MELSRWPAGGMRDPSRPHKRQWRCWARQHPPTLRADLPQLFPDFLFVFPDFKSHFSVTAVVWEEQPSLVE